MAKCIEPPETFRVRPVRRGRYYFVVYIAETRKAMLRAIHDLAGPCGKEWNAGVIGVTDPVNPWLLGYAFFHLGALGTGIVAHEMAHAGFRACEQRGVKVKHWNGCAGEVAVGAEEKYCCMADNLNRTFWNEFYDLYEAADG